MQKLLNWKISLLLLLAGAVWLIFTLTKPIDDWRHSQLVVLLPADRADISAAFELELAGLFAAQLNVPLKPIYLSTNKVVDKLNAHQAHFSASGLRQNSNEKLRYSDHFQTLNELVVCQDTPVRHLDDLRHRAPTIVAGSAQEAALKTIQQRLPDFHWYSQENITPNELLHQVADGKLDCTVANEEQLASARNEYPNLGKGFDLHSPTQLAWAFPENGDDELFALAQTFIKQIKRDGTLLRLIDHHFGHNERLEAIDATAFMTQIKTVLPHYRALFEEAERLTGIEWQLLAALAYQESHWNPLATSYTNVRGMMMLTEDTADFMHVENRLDARSSIIAGARYLQTLSEDLPIKIKESERIWFALAAYNQGMGHLEDARVLAAKMGLDPSAWIDIKKTFPLLSRPEYAANAKHGAARGGEAVVLVETVQLYRDMLQRVAPNMPPSPHAFANLSDHPSANAAAKHNLLKSH